MANVNRYIQPDDTMLLSPCGVNCKLCRSYIRVRNPCPGCRGGDCHKSKASITCAIKNCKDLASGKHQFCFSCAKFPCTELLHLDHRYQTRYSVSVIANLERIKAIGVERFVTEESAKWSCLECGSLLCMHKPQCVNCGYEWQHQ